MLYKYQFIIHCKRIPINPMSILKLGQKMGLENMLSPQHTVYKYTVCTVYSSLEISNIKFSFIVLLKKFKLLK
jgi:hypothetical protein